MPPIGDTTSMWDKLSPEPKEMYPNPLEKDGELFLN
jgi:hypothetical protein